MASEQPSPREYLKATLVEQMRLSETSAALLIEKYGELYVQRHATYWLWMTNQGKVHVPPAWLTASLKGDWSAADGTPSEWLRRCYISAWTKTRLQSSLARFARTESQIEYQSPRERKQSSWGFLFWQMARKGV